jgi:hypothetical protein
MWLALAALKRQVASSALSESRFMVSINASMIFCCCADVAPAMSSVRFFPSLMVA